MQASNLGVVFGPTLMRSKEETMAAIMNLKYQTIIVELMINEYDAVSMRTWIRDVGNSEIFMEKCCAASHTIQLSAFSQKIRTLKTQSVACICLHAFVKNVGQSRQWYNLLNLVSYCMRMFGGRYWCWFQSVLSMFNSQTQNVATSCFLILVVWLIKSIQYIWWKAKTSAA